MIRGSGDRDFDLALAHTLARIADVFQALPGFAFYDDYDGNNAYATPRPRLQRADGTVLLGQRLLAQLRARTEHPEIGVVSVCAHEFGHILQYKKGLDTLVGANQPTVKRIELQADFFAGFFAGMRKLERSDFPAAVFALMQFNAGDNMRNAKNHHGTDQERGAAVVRGFQAAFNERRSLSEAIQISINYVTQL
jgi:predicted metalloprotease